MVDSETIKAIRNELKLDVFDLESRLDKKYNAFAEDIEKKLHEVVQYNAEKVFNELIRPWIKRIEEENKYNRKTQEKNFKFHVDHNEIVAKFVEAIHKKIMNEYT